jgi:hypothetical protein
MRGERVPVYIVVNNEYDECDQNSFSENDLPTNINRFYSGYYIVDDIEISYHPTKDSDSNFTTSYTLRRREWPTPEAI